MNRPDRPAWGWRLLAWVLLVPAAAISLPAFLVTSLWGMIYIFIVWVALGGSMAYAYGRRARPLWFWRLFALFLSVWVMWDVGAKGERFLAALLAGLELGAGSMAIFLIAVPLNILMCVALLRHARLLRGGERAAMRELGEVFA